MKPSNTTTETRAKEGSRMTEEQTVLKPAELAELERQIAERIFATLEAIAAAADRIKTHPPTRDVARASLAGVRAQRAGYDLMRPMLVAANLGAEHQALMLELDRAERALVEVLADAGQPTEPVHS